MATCSNCKSSLSCGCQKRKASDGTAVCTKCQASYEVKLKQGKTITATPQVTRAWGKDRYK
jgi:hypothetical protein